MGGKRIGIGVGGGFDFVSKLETDRSASSLSLRQGFSFGRSQFCVCVKLRMVKIVILGGSESGFGAKVQKGSKKVQKGSFLTEALGICQKRSQNVGHTEAAHKR